MRVIAIDGPAGSGKSTVARALAVRLGLEYLDTGAMYRSVTFAALRRGVDPSEAEQVARIVGDIALELRPDGVTVDGVDATIEIRGPEVSRAVSIVAANPAVRTEMVRRQREWVGAHGGGVVEGRDIGSVVFPDAELKVYLTADPEVRAARRSKEVTDLDYETVAADLARRDALDQGRAVSPLTEAEDAFVVDTTGRSVEEILDVIAEQVARDMPEARPGDDVEIWTGEPTRGTRISYAVVRGLILFVAKLLGRVTIVGADKVPTTGAFVLAPVHRSNVDFALAALVTPRPMRYMGKDSIWKSKPLGRFVSMLGAFPVHRGTADRDALQACIDIVNGGSPLVMFPEGTRCTGPVIEELFDGTTFVAAKAGVPIIPVGIGGSEAMMPKGVKMLHSSRLVLVVGEPIPPPDRTEKGRVPRSAVSALTTRLHEELQDLFDDAQRRAGRPNPPR